MALPTAHKYKLESPSSWSGLSQDPLTFFAYLPVGSSSLPKHHNYLPVRIYLPQNTRTYPSVCEISALQYVLILPFLGLRTDRLMLHQAEDHRHETFHFCCVALALVPSCADAWKLEFYREPEYEGIWIGYSSTHP
jgi:hypothetical protein